MSEMSCPSFVTEQQQAAIKQLVACIRWKAKEKEFKSWLRYRFRLDEIHTHDQAALVMETLRRKWLSQGRCDCAQEKRESKVPLLQGVVIAK